MMIKDFDSRLRRLEKRRRVSGNNPILDALRNRTQEDIISMLIRSGKVSFEEARRMAREIKSDTPN